MITVTGIDNREWVITKETLWTSHNYYFDVESDDSLGDKAVPIVVWGLFAFVLIQAPPSIPIVIQLFFWAMITIAPLWLWWLSRYRLIKATCTDECWVAEVRGRQKAKRLERNVIVGIRRYGIPEDLERV